MEVTLDTLSAFAADFIQGLPGASEKAYRVGLSGELGAGKTAFVQEVARLLGVSALVTSPTFVIARAYPIAKPPFTRLIHIDAYRLAPSEKDTTGFEAYGKDPANLILVEWPENVPGKPILDKKLEFKVVNETTRDIFEV